MPIQKERDDESRLSEYPGIHGGKAAAKGQWLGHLY
jgi:hypothetical protein